MTPQSIPENRQEEDGIPSDVKLYVERALVQSTKDILTILDHRIDTALTPLHIDIKAMKNKLETFIDFQSRQEGRKELWESIKPWIGWGLLFLGLILSYFRKN